VSGPPFASPEAVEEAFYAAFAAADARGMEVVWAYGDPIACIHPGGGLIKGRQAVMQSWIDIFSGARPPTLEHRVVATFADGNLVVRLVEEHIRPSGNPGEEATRVLATNTYRREEDGWRLAAHHASLPMIRSRGSQAAAPRLH
jgi:ketosteroid isomerase-like protein